MATAEKKAPPPAEPKAPKTPELHETEAANGERRLKDYRAPLGDDYEPGQEDSE